MGELEEKETGPSETTPQQEVVDEPKETDKMLEKKNDADTAEQQTENADAKDKNPSPNAEKKKAASSKPTTPTSLSGKKSRTQSVEQLATAQAGAAEAQPARVNGGSGEEIIDIPETGKSEESDEKKISTQDREVKPKKIPIGGLKLPGFFMKNKPRADGDGADGELLEKENKDEVPADAAASAEGKPKKEEKPRSNFGERLRNFFVRKPAAEKQQTAKQTANGDADAKSEATAEAAAADGEANNTTTVSDAPPQKRGLLNAIKLPIANMIPRKKTDDDVELGMSKAGLASMETLDDSLKDQDCVDKAPAKNNGTDEITKLKKSPSGEIKQASPEEKSPEEPEIPMSFADRLRSYRCSVDDGLIVLGILLFILLLVVIGYVLSHETLTSPPLREGRFIDAVTGCGMVEGLQEDGAFAFRGIPYAQPPVGDQRWRAAQPISGIEDCWNGTLKAHNVSNYCTQRLGNGTLVGDEDCLYLDIITPHVRYTSPVPVIVLIGAETLTGPSPGVLRPSARYSRSHDVIFVRPNFRLGAFGFLALDVLTKDAYPRTSGNYALTDIIAALKWIQLNIAHFGGDPKSVTLLGNRAGGTLVSALVTSNKVNELYTRAWVSSSSAIFPGKPLEESEKRNEQFMTALDCQDVACLRTASTEQIWAATPDTWLHFPVDLPTVDENPGAHHEWLVLDGNILQRHPADAWKEEHTGKPKLVMGTTAHEAHTEQLRQRHANWTADEVRAFIHSSKIGALNLTEEAIRLYNATNYRSLVTMITDIRTICPLLTNARLQPSVPFYVVQQGEGEHQLASVDTDVLAILGRYEPHTVEQRRFVSSMQQLFYYYISHGTVPQYEPSRRVLYVAQDPLPQQDHPNCNFWIRHDIVPRYARVD
ncbi:PREDICTED: neurotactin [Rhagoletis zephyria]|uniref:neurotactin n=1 Tax=Rhagoletis zephyria TaxID=28612 RepID=UPI0008115173|nr:PREDICTED: neurotactin [Rhagoletis zephyria]